MPLKLTWLVPPVCGRYWMARTGNRLSWRRKTKVTTGLTDLSNIAAREKVVPDYYLNGLNGPTQEFIDEYIYLIGGAGAIPHYSYRKFMSVPIPDEIKKDPYLKGSDEYKWPLKNDIIQ